MPDDLTTLFHLAKSSFIKAANSAGVLDLASYPWRISISRMSGNFIARTISVLIFWITGIGVPADTTVSAISGSTITLSKDASSTTSSTLTFAAYTTAVPHAHGLLTSYCRNNVWMHLGESEFLWQVSASEAEKYRSYQVKYVVYDSPVANWKTDVDYDGFEFSAATWAVSSTETCSEDSVAAWAVESTRMALALKATTCAVSRAPIWAMDPSDR